MRMRFLYKPDGGTEDERGEESRMTVLRSCSEVGSEALEYLVRVVRVVREAFPRFARFDRCNRIIDWCHGG